jgi:hypothetical protein
MPAISPSFSRVYVKEYADTKSIEEEVTFSGLYRLDIGAKAAAAVFLKEKQDDGLKKSVGIASYELPHFTDYRSLFKQDKKNIRDEIFASDSFGRLKSIQCIEGLADVLMSAWLYGENDLHRGNLGIAHDKQKEPFWARLDFGMSFSAITQESSFLRMEPASYNAITLMGFQSFPDLGEYSPAYWPTTMTLKNNLFNLGGRYKGNVYTEADRKFFNALKPQKETAISRAFQQDKYAFIYQLFLNDINDKKKLIEANISDKRHANRLATNMENRILTMQWTALCDPGFREYVKTLDRESEKTLFEKVKINNQLVLQKITSDEDLEERRNQLQAQVNLIESNQDIETDYEKHISKVFELDLELDELSYQTHIDKEKLGVKKKALIKEQMHILQENLQKGKVNEGLRELNQIIYRRTALKPLTHLLSDITHLEGLYQYFYQVREAFVLPALVSLNRMGSDEIYQHELPRRLRHIAALVGQLKTNDKLPSILKELPHIESQKNHKMEWAITKTKEIELILIDLKYQSLLTPLSNRLEGLKSSNQPPVFTYLASNILKIKNKWLKPYLKQCLESNEQMLDIDKSPMVKSLFQVQRLFENVLSDTLMSTGWQCDFIKKDFERICHIVNEHELEKLFSSKRIEKYQVETMTEALLEIELVLTRLSLDLQIEKEKAKLNKKPSKLSKELVSASLQLSKALSKPEYHETLQMQEVSHAGYLGIMALKQPCMAHAKQCRRHALFLGNSHRRRLATKVAIALATISSVIVVSALATLCCAGSIGLGLSLVAWSSLGLGGGTFCISSGYATKRFLRDRDKVKRKLNDLGRKASEWESLPLVISI